VKALVMSLQNVTNVVIILGVAAAIANYAHHW
jgi:hypothetical protein